MIINIENLNYDFIEKNFIYFLTYRQDELCALFHKLELLDLFKEVVKKNNGIISGDEDVFFSEEDVLNALSEIKDICSSPIFLEAFLKYKDLDKEKLSNFFFMLSPEDILNIK